jgi:hypothetical protein
MVEWTDLLQRYGGSLFADADVREAMQAQFDAAPTEVDDYRDTGVTRAEDIARQFDRFFFGCEADDATTAWAYASDVNPFGTTLSAMLGSDIGHWDVTSIDDVMLEAYELIEDGRLNAEQFRSFTCDNVIRLHGQMNPRFFDGTTVQEHARTVLAGGDRANSIGHGDLPQR